MPHATPQAKQTQVVDLYREGKTYREITAATGVQGPVIADIVKKSGLPKRKGAAKSTTAATPAATQAATGATSTATAAASGPTVVASDLSEFQPPAPPAPRKPAQTDVGSAVQCANCRAFFSLDPGEDPATTPCPRCGVA